MVVVNDISRTDIGFDTTDNEVTLVGHDGDRPIALGSKAQVAATILDEVERLRSQAAAAPAAPAPPSTPSTPATGRS